MGNLSNFDGSWNPSAAHPFASCLQSFAQNHSISPKEAQVDESCFRFEFAIWSGIGLDVALYHSLNERVYIYLQAKLCRLSFDFGTEGFKYVSERSHSYPESFRLSIQDDAICLVARMRADGITQDYLCYLLRSLVPEAKKELRILIEHFGVKPYFGDLE